MMFIAMGDRKPAASSRPKIREQFFIEKIYLDSFNFGLTL